MADTDPGRVGQLLAATGGREGELDLALAPLGTLFAQIAEARWTPLFGSARADFGGTVPQVPASAVRIGAVVHIGGRAEGVLLAGLDHGAGTAAGGPDARALAEWVEGLGAGLAQLMGVPVQLRDGASAATAPAGGAGPVLEFACSFGTVSASAWLSMESALLERCLQALTEGNEADPASGTPAGAPPAAPHASPSGSGPFAPLPDPAGGPGAERLDVLLDVPLQVSVELGRTERQIREILALVPGSVLDLERLAGDPLDVLVNGKRIARAEVVVVDERFAIRITEILSPEERLGTVG